MSRKNRLKHDLRELVKHDIHRPFSRTRHSKNRISEKTIRDRWKFWWRLVDVLYASGLKLEKIRNFGEKHLEALFADWDRRQLRARTIQNHLPNLRYLARQIGKQNCLEPIIEAYSERKAREARERIDALLASGENSPEVVDIQKGKAWGAHGVDAVCVIDQIMADDSLVALQLLLMRTFGMRVREAHRFRPSRDWQDDHITLRSGTKGGRTRIIPVQDEEQRQLLEHARKVARQQGGSMMPERYPEKSWRSYYYSVLRRHGVTRKILGVTSHGLRHEYAQEQYQAVADKAAPVVSGAGAPWNPAEIEQDRTARLEVSAHLGHGRYDITRHYLDRMCEVGQLRYLRRKPRCAGEMRT